MNKLKTLILFSKKYVSYSMILISLIALIVNFQNCSNVGLEESKEPSVIRSSPTELKASVCSKVTLQPGASRKFIFIVDLSASNFGNWFSLDNKRHYFDPKIATDPDGKRFDAIENFIENCSQQSGDQFAIIGFSAAAGELTGNGLNCDNPTFKTPRAIKSEIKKLKDRQFIDDDWYLQWSQDAGKYLSEPTPDSLVYRVTSYTSASKCYEKLILKELQDSANSTEKYDIFFISDGIPEDKKGTGCNLTEYNNDQKTQCYLDNNLSSVTLSRTAAISKNKNLTIQGIYYGPSGVTIDVLNAMSIEGGTNGAKLLDGFDNNQTALCEIVTSQLAYESKPDILGIINLNVSRVEGEIQVDSDADGLTDTEEALYFGKGASPNNPRSITPGLLDSLCVNLSSVEKCLEWVKSNNCDQNLYDSTGLTDCDRKYIGFDSVTTLQNPADYDADGLIDFIEVIKGLDPTKKDLYLDPDQDGISNLDEIYRGSDPQFPDSYLDQSQLNQTSISFKSSFNHDSVCTYGQWDLSAQKLQTGLTLQNQNQNQKSEIFNYLNHKQFEHSVALVYRLTPMNGASTEIEYYLKGIRILPISNPEEFSGDIPNPQVNLQNINFISDPLQITPDLFKLIGKGVY